MHKKLTLIGYIFAISIGISLLVYYMTSLMRENDVRSLHAGMEKDADLTEVRSACVVVYRRTKDKSPGELTSRDLQRIRFCKEFGFYRE